MASPTTSGPEAPTPRGALHGLRRHIAWVLAAKLAILALLYAFFFAPGARPAIDAGAAGQRMHLPSR